MTEEEKVKIKHSAPQKVAFPLIRYIFSTKEKRCTQRALSYLTKGLWEMYGKEKAKSMLYYLGRQAGREIAISTETEYDTKRPASWEEMLGNIEIFCDLLAGSKAKVVDATRNSAIIRLWDSPPAYKLAGFSDPVCDYMAGIFASLPSFDFGVSDSTCREINCKASNYSINYCDFELKVVWPIDGLSVI